MRTRRFAALLLAPALLAGCGPLVQVGGNAKPPAALLTVSAVAPAGSPASSPAGTDAGMDARMDARMDRAVSVMTPAVPGALQTLRIPVTVSETQVQYVAKAQWSEQPARLFRQLVADRLILAGIPVVEARAAGGSGRRLLGGRLGAFGVDVSGAAPVVRVRYDATLATPDGVRQQRFERTEPLGRVEGPAAAAALNRAANAVATDIIQWLRG
jgi:cholesterol transport system auxiliary component